MYWALSERQVVIVIAREAKILLLVVLIQTLQRGAPAFSSEESRSLEPMNCARDERHGYLLADAFGTAFLVARSTCRPHPVRQRVFDHRLQRCPNTSLGKRMR